MITIESSSGYNDRTLEIRDDACGKNLIIHSGPIKGDLGITVNEAELLAALDAVPKGQAFKAGGIFATIEALKKTGGAVEVNGVRIEPCDEYGKTDTTRRAEAAEADRDGWQKLHNGWKDRAYAAEAKLKRVRDVEQRLADLVKRNEHTPQELDVLIAIRAALADPEPFVLPTEAGARVEAKGLNGSLYTFELWTNGKLSLWMDQSGSLDPFDSDVLMDGRFTNHRLIEAAG